MACPTELPLESGGFSLSEVPCSTIVLLQPDGTQHLMFQEAGRNLQLAVSGASVLSPVRLLTDVVVHERSRAARFAALESFNELLTYGKLPAQRSTVDTSGGRLRIVLQALDGWLAGARYRDIAVALFGEARVDADWSDPRDHLRDRVRRAIRRGRALMDGGYLHLLQCFLLLAAFPHVC